MSQQATRWVFTHQVRTNEDGTSRPDDLGFGDIRGDLHCARGDIRYAVWQLEIGDSGNLHHQGYVEFTRSRRRAFALGILPDAHWEVARADRNYNHDYCTKEACRVEGPWEIGVFEPLKQGTRNDLNAVKKTIESGASLRDLVNQHWPEFCRYNRGIIDGRRILRAQRDFQTELRIFYGPPGTGKSHLAKVYAGEDAYWLRRGNTGVWFDDYDGEHTVVIDDFDGWIPSGLLMQLADQYPLRVDTKHGSANFTSKSIIITTNYMPDMWYGLRFPFAALERRVTAWYHFTDPDHEYEPDVFSNFKDFQEHVLDMSDI